MKTKHHFSENLKHVWVIETEKIACSKDIRYKKIFRKKSKKENWKLKCIVKETWENCLLIEVLLK